MNYFDAFILGIVEGLTEFLPVSSTGHMILTSRILRLPHTDFLSSFEICIQLGAIMAVVVLYAKRLSTDFDILKKVFTAFIPTAVIGAVLYKFIKNVLFASPMVVVWSLCIGGVVIIVFEKLYKENEKSVKDLNDLSFLQAFMIGVCQSLAVIPGVSRAAATIIGGLSLGISRKAIVEFSFFLAIPTMAAASGLDLMNTAGQFSSSQFGMLAFGFLTAFFIAIVAIKSFLRFVQRHNFMVFGFYRIFISLLFLWVMS